MESDAEYNGALNYLNLCSRKKQNPFVFGLTAHCRAKELNTNWIDLFVVRFILYEAGQTCARETFRGTSVEIKIGMHKNIGGLQ